MWCDVSMGVWQLMVPKDFRQQVFDTTQGYVPPLTWSATGLCGQGWLLMSRSGAGSV